MSLAPPLLARATRRLGRHLARGLRALVVILAVLGLTPLGELVEHTLASPAAAEAGLAAAQDRAGDREDAGCQDAGCHGVTHHCSCCASGSGALASVAPRERVRSAARLPAAARDRAPPVAHEPPPLPPPRV